MFLLRLICFASTAASLGSQFIRRRPAVTIDRPRIWTARVSIVGLRIDRS